MKIASFCLRIPVIPRRALLAMCWGVAGMASAQTSLEISWGSSIMHEKMILSDGLSLESDGPVMMELGSFGSFVPTASNMSEWEANWKVFDAITYSDSDSSDSFSTSSGDPSYGRYTGSAELTDGQLSTSEDAALHNPDAQFGANEQAYVFIRTGDYSSGSQWLLFTSAEDSDGAGLTDSVWQFPAAGGSGLQFSQNWWLDQADTAIVGSINGGSENGGDTGGGDFTDSSTDYVLRLHTIPEPASHLLILLSAAVFFRRRRYPHS